MWPPINITIKLMVTHYMMDCVQRVNAAVWDVLLPSSTHSGVYGLV